MEPVETELLGNKEDDENCTGQTDGQTGDVDQRKQPVLADIPQSYYEKVTPHYWSVQSSRK
jgi:hypothetical protein